jgi:predicted N-acetyltransferase YhbS
MNTQTQPLLKDGINEMDFDKVTDMLKNAFWSIGIQKKEVMQGAQNSALVVGAFNELNQQIGYARAISDKTRFGFLLDVMVDENYRRQGIGQAMVQFITNHPALKDVYQWSLITVDAHGVYSKVGFTPVARPNEWMEIRNNRPNR